LPGEDTEVAIDVIETFYQLAIPSAGKLDEARCPEPIGDGFL
jgi:hypothetical protein